jgi:hypothetical protein
MNTNNTDLNRNNFNTPIPQTLAHEFDEEEPCPSNDHH